MKEREELHACLGRLLEKQLLIPISNNKADQLYLKLGAGIDSHHVPSLCMYTNVEWDKARAQEAGVAALWCDAWCYRQEGSYNHAKFCAEARAPQIEPALTPMELMAMPGPAVLPSCPHLVTPYAGCFALTTLTPTATQLATVMCHVSAVIWLPRSRTGASPSYQFRLWVRATGHRYLPAPPDAAA